MHRPGSHHRPFVDLIVGAGVLWVCVGLVLAALALYGLPIVSSYGRAVRGWPAARSCVLFGAGLAAFSAASGALSLWLGGRIMGRARAQAGPAAPAA